MNVLTTEQLYKAAPSLFTRGSAEHTSERYQPIATSDIIDVLRQGGFYPTTAQQSVSRNLEKNHLQNIWFVFDIRTISIKVTVFFQSWS